MALRITFKDIVLGGSPFPGTPLEPDQEIMISFRWQAPNNDGSGELTLEWVEQNVAVIGFMLRWEVNFTAPLLNRDTKLMVAALQHNPWFYLPSQGVSWSRHSSRYYPLFVETPKGSAFWDTNGNKFIDYVSGWGACLLGYAEPRIVASVQQSLTKTSLTTLPSTAEIELTEQLCQWFPGAEMVTYGKNGSDVCTAAVRLARAYTGRQKVLYCGYHGWQDWNAESFSTTQAAIPRHDPTLVSNFPPQNLEAVKMLFEQNSGEIAGVVIEPAAQIEGIDGPIRSANAKFLRGLAELCRFYGALLIFDEIFTGFRYRSGSVQQAVKVQPDLTCLGKALSAGLPLSALVGRQDIFQQAMHHIAYDSTFKGEPHSFAAALKAIEIYRDEPVILTIWEYGEKLMSGINQLCQELQISAQVVGLPIRMVLSFTPGPHTSWMRTFIQQQLLLQGILCFRNLMIPSYAHSVDDLEVTLKAYRFAFETLREAIAKDNLLQQIEIPLVL